MDFVVAVDPVEQTQDNYLLTDISTSGYGPGQFRAADESIELYSTPELVDATDLDMLFANQLAQDWR